jgi:hypothetical protein
MLWSYCLKKLVQRVFNGSVEPGELNSIEEGKNRANEKLCRKVILTPPQNERFFFFTFPKVKKKVYFNWIVPRGSLFASYLRVDIMFSWLPNPHWSMEALFCWPETENVTLSACWHATIMFVAMCYRLYQDIWQLIFVIFNLKVFAFNTVISYGFRHRKCCWKDFLQTSCFSSGKNKFFFEFQLGDICGWCWYGIFSECSNYFLTYYWNSLDQKKGRLAAFVW